MNILLDNELIDKIISLNQKRSKMLDGSTWRFISKTYDQSIYYLNCLLDIKVVVFSVKMLKYNQNNNFF